jgi:hypothetical protein
MIRYDQQNDPHKGRDPAKRHRPSFIDACLIIDQKDSRADPRDQRRNQHAPPGGTKQLNARIDHWTHHEDALELSPNLGDGRGQAAAV